MGNALYFAAGCESRLHGAGFMHPAARCGAVLRQASPRSWLLQPDQGRRLPRPGYTAWSGCDNPDAHATCAVRGSRQSDRASRGHRGQPKGGASRARGGQRARARRASPPCVSRVERGRARHLDRHVPLDFWPTCGRLSLHLTPRPCHECADSAQTGVFRRRHLPRLGPPPPMPSRISAPPHCARELTSVSFLVPQIALALVA